MQDTGTHTHRQTQREGVKKNLKVDDVRKRGGGQPHCQLGFFKEKKTQNVLKRKNMHFDEKFYEIYSFGPVCFIKIYVN